MSRLVCLPIQHGVHMGKPSMELKEQPTPSSLSAKAGVAKVKDHSHLIKAGFYNKKTSRPLQKEILRRTVRARPFQPTRRRRTVDKDQQQRVEQQHVETFPNATWQGKQPSLQAHPVSQLVKPVRTNWLAFEPPDDILERPPGDLSREQDRKLDHLWLNAVERRHKRNTNPAVRLLNTVPIDVDALGLKQGEVVVIDDDDEGEEDDDQVQVVEPVENVDTP